LTLDGNQSYSPYVCNSCHAAKEAAPETPEIRPLNSESEIVRYGIELVRREIQKTRFAPCPESELEEAYRRISKEDLHEDARMGRASAPPAPGELA
jgi:hypothetical protein